MKGEGSQMAGKGSERMIGTWPITRVCGSHAAADEELPGSMLREQKVLGNAVISKKSYDHARTC